MEMAWKTYQWRDNSRMKRRSEILKGEIFECAFCRGSGFLAGAKGIKCPVCRGEGAVSIEAPAVLCAFCNGRGKAYPRTNITCPACFGKGVMSAGSEDIETCPSCKGRGRKAGSNLPCLTCRGKGAIPKPKVSAEGIKYRK
jgi:DnaJ-class molecular chaperone